MCAVEEHCFSVTLRRGGAVTNVIDVPDTFEPQKSPVLVLAHGAGNDLRSAFLETFAALLCKRGLCVVRFNFPYKEKTGQRPPDKMDVLADTFVDVITASGRRTGSPPGPLFLGGKSMGGRVALEIVAAGRVRPTGLVYLGYPLHPPGKPEKLRVAGFRAARLPHLFVQGTRDPFSDLDLLRRARKELRIPGSLHLVEGGDHSFKQPAARRQLESDECARAADVIVKFVDKVLQR
jgi:predicted alpha/beta-hydrolase family hydrolase